VGVPELQVDPSIVDFLNVQMNQTGAAEGSFVISYQPSQQGVNAVLEVGPFWFGDEEIIDFGFSPG